jgi:putative transcriptional regulator
MKMPNHHPSDALLVAYGAGGLSEALALAVAVHLAACSGCRAKVNEVEAVGGALLEDLPEAPLRGGALDDTLRRLDDPVVTPVRDSAPTGASTLPDPLRPYIGSLSEARWRRVAPGIRQIEIGARTPAGGSARLLRVAPGTTLPNHGHGGIELTVILSGSYSDEIGRFGPGDVAELDAETVHQPLADTDEDCVCLIATEAPLRFTGLFGRLIQPLLRI